MKLRVGLIGLGNAWQTRHRPALRMLQNRFEVRAVYNAIAKLSDACAAEFQADLVGGYRALVSRSDIDAVMILQETWQGWLPVIAACEAGKAIYWAGDLRFDPGEHSRILEMVESSGVAFMAEFTRRFAPATLRLKELIATKLGQPSLLFCHRRISPNAQSKVQESDQELIELIDWCRFVVGREPKQVTSMAHNENECVDYCSVTLHFAATDHAPAATAQLSCGSYIPDSWHEANSFRPPAAMQVRCERGIAFVDLPSSLVWFDDAGRHMEALETESPVGEQLLIHFHRSVTSLVRNLANLDDACKAVEILAAAKQSSKAGTTIKL